MSAPLPSTRVIAEGLGVAASTISGIKRLKYWGHVS